MFGLADKAVASAYLFLADTHTRRLPDTAPLQSEDREAGRVIGELINNVEWIIPLMRAVGALLFVFMIVKIIWDRRRGQAGGGGQIGQAAAGLFGLVILFVPAVIPLIADFIIMVAIGVIEWIVGLLG